jgi:pyruvate,water dikinase
VAAGRLDSADQIFNLEIQDISRAESDPSLGIRTIAEANRAYFAQFNPHNDPPVLIDSRGKIPTLPPRPLEESELAGTPVSPGVVIGRVRVLTRVEGSSIQPGEILVTKATDPGWTPLFLNARGVLLESGGTLQHGASVARELGKPCIVGIERVTKILIDGQTVEMDGANGIVRILE